MVAGAATQVENASNTNTNSQTNSTANRDKLIADSENVLAVDIANAERTYTVRSENSRVDLWKANAASKLTTLQAWDAIEETTWTAYQVELANNEVAYYNQLATKHTAYILAKANAEYERQIARASAQHDFRYAMIDADLLRKQHAHEANHVRNTNSIVREKASADAESDNRASLRTGQNDTTFAKNSANAAYDYAITVTDANHKYVTDMVDARQFIVTRNTCANNYADRRYPWSWSVVVVPITAAANIYNTFAKTLNQANHDLAVANVLNGAASTSALMDLWNNYQKAKENRGASDANSAAADSATLADALSTGEYEYAISAMAAQGVRSNSYSDSDLQFTIIVTPIEKDYEIQQVVFVGVQENADAISSRDFKLATANEYASAMNSWNSGSSNPWTVYHTTLGTIEVAWAVQASLTSITRV